MKHDFTWCFPFPFDIISIHPLKNKTSVFETFYNLYNWRGAAFTITQNSLETARQAGKSSLFGSYNGQATGQRVTQVVTTATRCIPLVDFVFER